MSFLRPIHWYHSRADLIWAVGPFKITVAQTKTFLERTAEKPQLGPDNQREVRERKAA
jgi:hypothetical protein